MSFPGVPWVVPPLPCAEEIDASVDQDEIAAVATEVLFVLSGRQFGVRTQTVRPRVLSSSCASRRACLPGGSSFPEWGVCGGRTFTIDELAGPILDVTEIRVDGVVLDPAAYRVSPGRITRTDGQSFPCCQDEVDGGLLVSYSWGKSVPDTGLLAARELACQLALAAAPATSGKCKLPTRVQTISRQGITMALLDPQDFLDNGRTGLYLCDLFLSAFNPGKSRRRARVFSPDVPHTIT